MYCKKSLVPNIFCKTVLAVAAATVAACAFAKEYPLARDGQATSCIVLPDNAGPVEKHAASELVLYLEKVTGAKVNIEIAPSKDLYNIYLGTTEAKNVPCSVAIEKAISQLKDEGFVLAADKEGVRVIGKEPIGVLYGTYEILRKQADVRWFAPGADFEYCPKKPTVAVPEQITVSNPSFKFRVIGFYCANTNSKIMDTWNWMARNRMTFRVGKGIYNTYRDELEKRGSVIFEGGHAFSTLLSDDLFDEHPEYFPLIDGKRRKQSVKGMEGWPQPCTSNPKVAEIMAQSLNRILDAPPKGVFLIGNNDDTRWCQCENCAKIDPLAEREKHFVSTRYFTLVNQIAGEVYKTHPDADLWAWAYQNFQYPPTGVVPDKRLRNIMVCVHGRCYRHPIADEKCQTNARYREILSAWMRLGNPVMTYEYNFCEIPRDSPLSMNYMPLENVLCQDIKHYYKLGLKGFQLTICPPDGTFGPLWNSRANKESWYASWQLLYLSAQLAWNVNADYGRLVDDMGSKYYGSAWSVMKRYREELLKMYEGTPGDVGYGTPLHVYGKCLEKPGVEAMLLQLLDEAEKAAAGDDTAIKKIRRDREYFGMCWQNLHKEFLAKRQKEIHVDKCANKIVIDGRFDEADWKTTDFTSNFVAIDGKTAAEPPTFVKMLYAEDNIYLAVEAMEPEPGKMRMNVKERDGSIWEDSSVELFIATPGVDGKYAQIVVNPKGVFYDAMTISAGNAEITFDSGTKVKTRILADRWVAEIRIATASLGRKIRDGETWKMNIARNRRLVDGTSQSSSWSNGIFHGPEAFRSVVFGGTALLRNGDFEDVVEPSKSQKENFGQFIGNRVPAHWTFHEGNPGTAALIDKGAASGRQFLRISDGAVYTRINQSADCRNDLRIRAKVCGQGVLTIALYRYDRSTEKNDPTIYLEKIDVGSQEWDAIETTYKCEDDRILRLAFHVKGEVDLDDVSVNQETNPDGVPTR